MPWPGLAKRKQSETNLPSWQTLNRISKNPCQDVEISTLQIDGYLAPNFASWWFLFKMFYFLFLFLAFSTFIFASPISDDSDNPDLDHDTVSFNSNTGSENEGDLDSSILLSNEVIVANSAVNVIEPLCESETSIDNLGETDNNIQKRSNVCSAQPQGKPSLQALPKKSIYGPRKSTSSPNNPCDRRMPHYVSCGGPEVPDNNSFITDLFRSVLNCVPGVFSRTRRAPAYHFNLFVKRWWE